MPQGIPRYLATNPCRLQSHTVAASNCAWLQPTVAHGCSLLHLVAGLNLSGLSSGTVHRAVGLSSAGRVHDASWDTESLFLTLQVFPTYHHMTRPRHYEVFPSYHTMSFPPGVP